MHERNSNLLTKAKVLRKAMTSEESHLWYDYLRDYPIRFRRQEIIGRYIVDFYCSQARLVIELDGAQHYEIDRIVQHDVDRTRYLESQNLEVIRFLNRDVRQYFEGVCLEIDKAVKRRMKEFPRCGE